MQLVRATDTPNVATYNKTDWSVNKRVYKHKVFTKKVEPRDKVEFIMLFKLA